MSLRQTVQPLDAPVVLDDVKQQLWLESCDSDGLLFDLTTAAIRYVEDTCATQLITATWEWTLDRFEDILFVPRAPLQSVTSITYIDDAGSTQAIDPSGYVVDAVSQPGQIRLAYGECWPTHRSQHGAVTVTFVAGYGDGPSDVPGPIRRAICILAAHLYENRTGCAADIPAVDMLLLPYRMTYRRATVQS